MNPDFKTWLVEEYGLQESAAISRVANISTIEKYYGEEIDTLIKNRGVHSLLNELSYSTDDERNNRPQKHKVPISGNIRTGSATLKQAVSRYVEFWNEKNKSSLDLSDLQKLAQALKNSLNYFKPTKEQKSYAGKYNGKDINEVKEYIQQPLTDYLKKEFPNIKWEMEYQLSDEIKDSVDIVGIVNDNAMVLIEIDTRRSDQVSKKFVSRQALTDNLNTIYAIVTYPNTNSQSKPETVATEKYIKYITSLTSLLMQGSNLEKYIIAHNL